VKTRPGAVFPLPNPRIPAILLAVRFLLLLLALCLIAPGADAQRGKKKKTPLPRPPVEDPNPERTAELARIAAEREAERRAEIERDVPLHFRLCDLDESGWVSFREAEVTLGIDKDEFRRSDGDGDGRIGLTEFASRYQRMLDLLGPIHAPVPTTEELERRAVAGGSDAPFDPRLAVVPDSPVRREPTTVELVERTPVEVEKQPRPKRPRPTGAAALFPSPGQLLALYDADQSNGLSLQEVRTIVLLLGDDLSPELILQQTDRDETGELEMRELAPLAYFASKRMPVDASPPEPVQASTLPQRATPGFSRLDVNADGLVEATDLMRLLDGTRTVVRLSTVIAVLDRDGDGGLSDAEFRAALGAPGSGR